MPDIFTGELTAGRFIRFVTPSIIMMIFIGTYSLVDALFVAHFMGSDGLAAVNIVFPASNLIYAIGVMLAVGGGAIVSIRLGEDRIHEAREKFSLILVVCLVIGVLACVAGVTFLDPILRLLGAEPRIFDLCYEYAWPFVVCMPFFLVAMAWGTFIRADGSPGFALIMSVACGVLHIVLDYIFMGRLGWGIAGAAWATNLNWALLFLIGIFYFLGKPHYLRFTRPRWDWRFLLHACGNGSSEMVNEFSIGISTIIFNLTLLKLVGVDGVAAFSIILYMQFFLISLYLGYSMGAAPLFSFNYGAAAYEKNRRILHWTKWFLIVSSIVIFLCAVLLDEYMVMIFEAPGSNVYDLSVHGFLLFAPSFLFIGFNIFGSGFFTALGNGKISAAISFSRSLLFVLTFVGLLPLVLGVDGVWLAIPAAEFVTIFLTWFFYRRYRERYHY